MLPAAQDPTIPPLVTMEVLLVSHDLICHQYLHSISYRTEDSWDSDSEKMIWSESWQFVCWVDRSYRLFIDDEKNTEVDSNDLHQMIPIVILSICSLKIFNQLLISILLLINMLLLLLLLILSDAFLFGSYLTSVCHCSSFQQTICLCSSHYSQWDLCTSCLTFTQSIVCVSCDKDHI